MAAPSKNFTPIADGSIDADSPLDVTLMTQIRDSLIHLEEWLGKNYTAAEDHDHNGTNSKLVSSVGAAAVGQAQLKTTTGAVSTAAASVTNLTLPGGEYGFYPQLKSQTPGYKNMGSVAQQDVITPMSYTTLISLWVTDGSGTTAYAQQRYIQASPPYMIGNVEWGHFLFLLRDIATGTVRSAYEAEDPPWAYNGAIYLPKDDPGRLNEVPHPFVEYWQKDPAIDGLEIVMLDLRNTQTKKWKQDNAKLGKGILEDLGAVVKGKGTLKAHADYMLPAIPKFTDKVKIIIP